MVLKTIYACYSVWNCYWRWWSDILCMTCLTFFSFNPAHKYIFCFIQFWTKRKEKVGKRYFSQFLNNLQTYFYYMPYFFNDVIIWLTWLEGKREWKRGLWDFKKTFWNWMTLFEINFFFGFYSLGQEKENNWKFVFFYSLWVSLLQDIEKWKTFSVHLYLNNRYQNRVYKFYEKFDIRFIFWYHISWFIRNKIWDCRKSKTVNMFFLLFTSRPYTFFKTYFIIVRVTFTVFGYASQVHTCITILRMYIHITTI